jgi:hypothetical protein
MTLQSTSTSLDLTTDENISLAQLRNQLLQQQQQQPLTISPQQNDNQNTQNAQNLISNSQTTTSDTNFVMCGEKISNFSRFQRFIQKRWLLLVT